MNQSTAEQTTAWELLETIGEPEKRHEAAFVECNGKFYLLGGRRMNPVSIYDPDTNTWKNGSIPPMEIHHFQPVAYKDRIIMVGVMTGPFPTETAVERVLEYYPATDTWSWSHEIPAERRRGGSGAVLYNGKIYVVCGIIHGHMGGYVNWLDEYDPETGDWKTLPDAPHARDHFQAALLDGKIYAGGGRRTSAETKQVFDLVEPEMDIYDIEAKTWTVAKEPIPTPRAGCFSMTNLKDVIILGGESMAHKEAHDQVEAYNTLNEKWRALPPLLIGRHGTGAFIHENYVYTCSGCRCRGGNPEITEMERIEVSRLST